MKNNKKLFHSNKKTEIEMKLNKFCLLSLFLRASKNETPKNKTKPTSVRRASITIFFSPQD